MRRAGRAAFLPRVAALLQRGCDHVDAGIRQRSTALLGLYECDAELLRRCLPASEADVDLNGAFDFLDDIVADAMRKGARPYRPRPKAPPGHARAGAEARSPDSRGDAGGEIRQTRSLSFAPYEPPAPPISNEHPSQRAA